LKKSLILLIILILLSLLTKTLAKASDFDFSKQPVLQTIGKPELRPNKTVNLSPYKDNNEKLYAVVGKTQLIKFDEPVKRISITDPSLADLVLLSPRELLLNGKAAGRTSLVFWGNSDKPIFFNMVVQQDTDAVIQAIEQVAPEEDIKYNFTDDGLILTGSVSSATVKKNIENVVGAYGVKLVNLTESPTKQVLLEVKITEASRDFSRNLASEFRLGNTGSTFSDLSNAAFGKIGEQVLSQYVFSSTSQHINWVLTAAETKGMVKILAEPKLLAIDGQEGSFNVGNEIPYPSAVAMSGSTSYTFKNTGVILKFTPTILEKSNRVILKLSPEVSEIDNNYKSSTGVPGFKTRKVDTTVELADGETLVIAGLLSHNSQVSDSKIPVIGDIPGIGFLFSSLSREKHEIELVIFITPKIVEVDKRNSRMEL
jgi:pilus assembly protein CpaC